MIRAFCQSGVRGPVLRGFGSGAEGDLRLYGWVQFYPILAIPLLLWLYYRPAVKAILPVLVWIVVWYVIAKVLEQLDYPIYRAAEISGHSLKHLAAAVSTWYFVALFRRQYLSVAVAPEGI